MTRRSLKENVNCIAVLVIFCSKGIHIIEDPNAVHTIFILLVYFKSTWNPVVGFMKQTKIAIKYSCYSPTINANPTYYGDF